MCASSVYLESSDRPRNSFAISSLPPPRACLAPPDSMRAALLSVAGMHKACTTFPLFPRGSAHVHVYAHAHVHMHVVFMSFLAMVDMDMSMSMSFHVVVLCCGSPVRDLFVPVRLPSRARVLFTQM